MSHVSSSTAGSAPRRRLRPLLAALLLAGGAVAATPASAVVYRSLPLSFSNGQIGSGPLGTVPGLVTIDLSYTTEHNVLELRAMPRTSSSFGWDTMTGLFRDENGDDAYSGTVRWAELETATDFGEFSSSCGGGLGTCRLIIPKAAPGEVFILSGIRFRFTDDDHYISEIAVRPNPVQGYVDVTFTDNSRQRPFTAEIAWAYIPSSAVSSLGFHYQSSHSSGSVSFPGSRRVLQGFRVHFDSGDHPLKRFTIDLNDGVRVRLHDNDMTGDTIGFWVDYVVLAD
jgi:hypothetical protein